MCSKTNFNFNCFTEKKRKRYKLVLQKYEKAKSRNTDDSGSESSCEEIDLFDSAPPSPLFKFEAASGNKNEEHELKSNQNEVLVKKVATRLNEDSDSLSNEIVSEDTGRGSSLAFSDVEKCINSPDYFCNDSPFGSDSNKIKVRRVYVDACTSPSTVHAITHIATSPILFDDEALLSDNNTISPNKTDSNSNEYFITDIPISTEIVTIKERKQLVDVSTNTTIDIEKVDISTSPLAFEELEVLHNKSTHLATSPTLHVKDSSINNLIALNDVNTEDLCDNNANKIELTHTTVRSLSSTCELEISSKTQEKTCLELNSSKNLCNENSNDCEIEMILKSMRLTDKIITPIPKTPINLNDKSSSKQSPVKQLSVLSTKHKVCPEAMILREENKALQTSIADLSKEIMNIKCILKNQFLMPEKSKKQVCENKDKSILNSEPFDDSNQRPLFINFDSEQSSDHIDNEEMSVTPELPVSFSTQENVIDSVQNYTHTRKDKASQVDKSKETLNKEETLVVTNISSDGKEVRPFLDSRKTIEKNLRHEDDEICTKEKEYVVLNDNKDKKVKCKKLSRLETFRKKLLPKNKIKKINVPIRKLRSKARPIHIKTSKNTDTEILLNNKPAYEKALKIMTELKLKKNTDKKESSMTTKVKKLVTDSEKVEQKDVKNNSVNLRRKSKEGNLNDNISTIEQPSVGLSELKCQNNEEKQQRDNNILTTSPKKTEGRLFNTDSPTRSLINTRSRSKINQDSIIDVDINNTKCRSVVPMSEESQETFKECNKSEARRRLKRLASDNPIIDSKRILRSKNMTEKSINRTNVNETILTMDNNLDTPDKQTHKQQSLNEVNKNIHKLNQAFDECSEQSEVNNPKTDIEQINTDVNSSPISHPKESILCKMIEKFGKVKIKFSAQKIPDDISDSICKKLEEDIANIIELPIDKSKTAMNKLVEDIQQSWNLKNFQVGFMKYLKDPARKRELFNKVSSPPAPPMTKSEQVLLFVMKQLEISIPNTVNVILTQIEFSLFQLNKSPEFDVIESLSHFYALLCRYFGLKNRIRIFLLDAMYCLQFKVVPLIKQCLDVWMHILPLAHMGIAKSPLVTCLVYLLHFYKCEDRLNRIQDIRFILNKKYFYQITDWNENKILEMFSNSIKEIRDIKIEKKMLRMAFIILAKRQGPKWCQKNIIKNMLIPMIEKEDVPIRIKQFCVEMLGPLLKPYPMDMKVHCEIIVNQLLDMLDENTSDSMKEAIFTSLIYMNKHNQSRVTQALLSWSPKQVSPEFEELMRDFVQEKNLKVWKGILSRITL
ncbi:unnamed protein product [Euphydryas editha]|uniref:Uncharacterized protein n=1 Tax=Euphydryas editha TaxID=104508 RepID=A0AAU9V657_EUPED|nr:unnamed protein product [Euphydryas editha]